MAKVVLDASAILALIFKEPGGDVVAEHLPGALVSTVNIAEVVTRLLEYAMPQEIVDTIIDALQLTIKEYDYNQAKHTAQLRESTRSAGLSLGDRACLALAQKHQTKAVTADGAWESIAGATDLAVTLIR